MRWTASHAGFGEPGPLVGIAAALLSGVLYALASGLSPAWWAAWIAPVPVLWVAAGVPQRGLWLGLLTGFVASATVVRYYVAVAGPLPALVIVLGRALAWGLVIRTAAAAESRLSPMLAVFALPTLVAALEMLVAALSPHGTAGSLAYSQIDFLPALQAAALGGVPAVAFVPSLFASALLLALRSAAAGAGGARLALVAPVAVIAAALVWGELRARSADDVSGPLAALVASDAYEGTPADWERVWSLYRPGIEQAAAKGARVAVLPEKIVRLDTAGAVAALAQVSELASRDRIDILFGVLVDDGARQANRALFAEASGRTSAYDKQHLVPGWEGRIVPGHAARVVDTDYGRVGIAICKDMDFAVLGLDYARAGVQRMLVPAWDFRGAWGGDGWSHGRMATLRGIEGGFDVARSARIGRLTASDPYGRVTVDGASDPGLAVVVVPLPAAADHRTVYASVGNLFGWLCVAAAAGFWFASGVDSGWRRRLRARSP